MKKILFSVLCLAVIGLVSCTTKKNRLTSDTLAIAIEPPSVTISTGAAQALKAICTANGSAAAVTPSWSIVSNITAAGIFNPTSGKSTTFTAGPTPCTGTICATVSNIKTSIPFKIIISTGGGGGGGITTIGIYSDSGLYSVTGHQPNIYTWGFANNGAGNSTDLTAIIGNGAPGDSVKYLSDSSGSQSYVGWGVIIDDKDGTFSVNLSAYANGHITFYLYTNRALTGSEAVKINVGGPALTPTGAKNPASPDLDIGLSYGWDNTSASWQQVSVPLSAVIGGSNISLSQISLPFEIMAINLTSPITMNVDYVQWTPN